MDPGECVLELNEYYENVRYVSHYFFCEPVGTTQRHLTEREQEVGMEPRWVSVEQAIAEFSRHREYADTDEMRRGLYQREYTALRALLTGSGGERP